MTLFTQKVVMFIGTLDIHVPIRSLYGEVHHIGRLVASLYRGLL